MRHTQRVERFDLPYDEQRSIPIADELSTTSGWNLTLLVIASFGLAVAVFTCRITLPVSLAAELATEVPLSDPRLAAAPPVERPAQDSVATTQDVNADSVAKSEPAPPSSDTEPRLAAVPTIATDDAQPGGLVAPVQPEPQKAAVRLPREASARHARSKRTGVQVARKKAEKAPAATPATQPPEEKKLAAKAPAPAATQRPEEKKLAASNDAAPASSSEEEPGLLRINSRPWSEIFIDGRSRGATPNLGLPLAPGQHTVKLVNSVMGLSKSFEVKIGSGTIVTKVVNLGE